MTALKFVTLGQYITQKNTRNKILENINVFSVTQNEGFVRSSDFFYKKVFSQDLSNYIIVNKNDFAYNPSRVNIGSIAYLKEEYALVSPLYVVFSINTNVLNPEYLLRYLKSSFGITQIRKKTQGAVRDSLRFQALQKIQIPLPTLIEQEKIADVLSRADRLIAMRKESIKVLDDLIQSTFLDMFGDPVKNEKKWPVEQISDVVLDIISGTSYGGEEKSTLANDELGVLKISAVTQGVFNPEEIKAVKNAMINKKIITVKKGMLLFSRANTKELVAACCIVDSDYPKLFLPDKLWSIVVDERKINNIFLSHVLKNKSFRDVLRNQASGGHESMLNISMKKFNEQVLIVPPLDIQMDFAKFIEKISCIRENYLKGLADLSNLNMALSNTLFH